jgi:NTE family protein
MVTTAFVLSGGGSLGAVQVGMLQALAAHGVRPDLLVGTSAGAVNAAWVAGHGWSVDSLDQLARVWAGLRRGDIFPVEPRQMLRGLLGRSTGVTSDTRLRRLVQTHAVIDDLAQARLPTHLVAADLLSGADVLISTGDPVDGVLASAAIPGILPPSNAPAVISSTGRWHSAPGSPRRSTSARPWSTSSPPGRRARCQAHPEPRSGWRCTR